MQLRWAVYQNKVTMKEVRAHREKTGEGTMTVRKKLTNVERVLEYLDPEDQTW